MDGKNSCNFSISKEKWSNRINRIQPRSQISYQLLKNRDDPVNHVSPLYSIQQPVRTTIQFSLHDECRTHASSTLQVQIAPSALSRVFTRHC